MKKLSSFTTSMFVYFLLGPTLFAQYSADNTAVYNLIRDNQTKFPKPQSMDTIYVGTFDPATEEFTGLKTIRIAKPGSRPPFIITRPNVGSYSPMHVLKFSVNSTNPDFSVAVNGTSFRNNPGKKDIYVNIKGAKNIQWKLESQGHSFSDQFSIRKNPFVATGVMKIPLLPVALLYEPSPDRRGTTRTSYSVTNVFSSTVSMGFSEGKSTTKPEPVSSEKFKGLLGMAANALSYSSDPIAKGASTMLNTIIGGWGSRSVTSIEGQTSSNEMTFTNVFSESISFDSGENDGGPGIGDNIFCLKNCRILWLIYNDSLKIVLLDSEGKFAHPFSAKQVKEVLLPANPALFDPIAKCDPFIANGLSVTLPSSRYKYLGPYTVNGSGQSQTYTLETVVEESDVKSKMNYSTRVEDVQSGWLGALGISPNSETSTTTIQTSHSLNKQIKAGQKVTASMYFNLAIDETASFDIYFDKIFGTFVVRKKPGQIKDQNTR